MKRVISDEDGSILCMEYIWMDILEPTPYAKSERSNFISLEAILTHETWANDVHEWCCEGCM